MTKWHILGPEPFDAQCAPYCVQRRDTGRMSLESGEGCRLGRDRRPAEPSQLRIPEADEGGGHSLPMA